METYFNGMVPKSGSARRLWFDLKILFRDLAEWIGVKLGKKSNENSVELVTTQAPSPETLSRQSRCCLPRLKIQETARRHPLGCMGVALVAGVVVGFLLSRKE